MPRVRSWLIPAALVAGLAATPASATIVPPVSFETLVQTADVVFAGDVVQVEPRWVDTGSGRAIVTRVTFRVDRVLKGSPRLQVALDLLGGRVGDTALLVPGVPQFAVGERVIVCARDGGGQVSPIVGFNQGRFRVTRDPQTGREYVTTHDGWAFATTAELGRARAQVARRAVATMTREAFEDEIRRAAGGAR
jgi:hypothetical protein